MLSAALALIPEIGASARHARASKSRLDRRIPPPEYELGPEAWARERGLNSIGHPIDRPKHSPSWTRLVKDLNRRSAKARAREMIEDRVPPSALEWLREMIKNEDWLALRLVGHGRTREEIREQAALVALRWELERQSGENTSKDVADDGGTAAPPPTLKP